MPGCRVYQYVDSWERVAILRACFVEVSKIYAHPLLPASFLNHYHVCQPVRVVHLPYEVCFLKFANLFSNGLVSFQGEHSLFLSDGGKGRRYIQPMYNDRRIYSGHILVGLGKHISVAFQESRQFLADGGTSKGPNLSGSSAVRVVKKHLFKFLYRFCRSSVFFYMHCL